MRWMHRLLACRICFCFWRCKIFYRRKSRFLRKFRLREDARGPLLIMDFPFCIRLNCGNNCVGFPCRALSVEHLHCFLIFVDFFYLSCGCCLELGWWLAIAEGIPRFRWGNNNSSCRRSCWICWSCYSRGATWERET